MQINKLKGKLKEKGFNYLDFARIAKISISAFNQKINGKKPFKQNEIKNIKNVLNLTNDELVEIFFS